MKLKREIILPPPPVPEAPPTWVDRNPGWYLLTLCSGLVVFTIAFVKLLFLISPP